MKKRSEIILNDQLIDGVDDILPLNVGDIFWFSIRGTTPRSEKDYRALNDAGKLMGEDGFVIKKEFIDSMIDSINKNAHEYHIKQYEVIKISKSYGKDYDRSIHNPNIEFVVSIYVVETKE